jgi:hypothetical protein
MMKRIIFALTALSLSSTTLALPTQANSSYIKLKAPSAQECDRFAAQASKTLNTKMNVRKNEQLNDQTSNAGGETCHVWATFKGSRYGDPNAKVQAMLRQSGWKEDKQNTNMFYKGRKLVVADIERELVNRQPVYYVNLSLAIRQ